MRSPNKRYFCVRGEALSLVEFSYRATEYRRINGAAAKEAILRADDEILIGDFRLRFEDSASRKITSYGKVKLPPRFAEVLRKSFYAGSALAVESPAGPGPAGPAVGAGSGRRGKPHDQENKLHRLLYRVNRALGELNSIEEVNHRTLDFVLEIDGAERGFAMRWMKIRWRAGHFVQASTAFYAL